MCSFSVTVHGLVSVELSLTPPCSLFIRPVNSMLVVEFWHAVCTVVSVQSSYWDVVHLWTCLSTQRREEKHLHRKIIHVKTSSTLCCVVVAVFVSPDWKLPAGLFIDYRLLYRLVSSCMTLWQEALIWLRWHWFDKLHFNCHFVSEETIADGRCVVHWSAQSELWHLAAMLLILLMLTQRFLCQAVLLNFSKMMPTVCKFCSLVGCRPLLEKWGH